MNNDVQQIWEAHEMSLRDPKVTDEQTNSLEKKIRALDAEEVFILALMQTDDYNEVYDSRARLYHTRRLRDIPREKSMAHKKYSGT